MKDWKHYEQQVLRKFKEKYPNQQIEYNKHLIGKHSKVNRQIDILITTKIADKDQYGVFDCKRFNKKVNVKSIDSMIGYMQDIGANYGGIITCEGFTRGAINRAKDNNVKLEIIEFESPEKLIEHFVPSLNFSDPRNSMYISLI